MMDFTRLGSKQNSFTLLAEIFCRKAVTAKRRVLDLDLQTAQIGVDSFSVDLIAYENQADLSVHLSHKRSC